MPPNPKAAHTIKALEMFQIDPERGFLPARDPLQELPATFSAWEEIARDLPKLLAAGRARNTLEKLPVIDTTSLQGEREYQRAMLLLSYFGHAYVWGEGGPPDRIPASIAVPWCEVAHKLGRPPILSYGSYALHNWRRIDPSGPISLGNIALLQNFLGGVDEEWFILVHVDIEAQAAPALSAILQGQEMVLEGRAADLVEYLATIASSLRGMYGTLLRMPEHCDPYIYFHRVRPYIHGWKDHPALPGGMVYEGVDAYGGKGQRFRGETGAQSTIIPSLDAALGIAHGDDPLRPYLMEMREYAPPKHRAFIESVERGASIRDCVMRNAGHLPALRDAYNECVHQIELFRSKHLEYAATYVQKQSLKSPYNPTEVGTGGTPFLPYLKKHRDETTGHKIF